MDVDDPALREKQHAVEELMKRRSDLLHEQKALSVEMNGLLNQTGGMISNSTTTVKNLNIAVERARFPGHFQYYATPDSVRQLERRNDLAQFAKRIHQKQLEISSVDREIKREEDKYSVRSKSRRLPSLRTMDQWFKTYGSPSKSADTRCSRFSESTRIYGSTEYHKGFRSVAKKMLKGPLID